MRRREAVQALFAVTVGTCTAQSQEKEKTTFVFGQPDRTMDFIILMLGSSESIVIEWQGKRKTIKIQEMFDALDDCTGLKCVNVNAEVKP